LSDTGKPVSSENHSGTTNSRQAGTLPLRYSISQFTTHRASFEEDVDHFVDAGIPSIGIWRRKVDEFGEQAAAERIAAAELNVSSISFIGGFTGSAGMTYCEAMDDAYSALFTAAAFGAECLIVCPGSRGRYTTRHEHRLVLHALQELAVAAAEFGLQLALMPMRSRFAHRWTTLTSLDDVLETVSEVDKPNVGMVLDTFHLGHDRQLVERIPEFADRVSLVQLSDAPADPQSLYDRRLPGEGVLPLSPIISTLLANDFQGSFDLQIWSENLWNSNQDVAIQRTRDALLQVAPTHSRTASEIIAG